MDKIVDLLGVNKAAGELPLPLEVNAIVEQLNSIPKSSIEKYVDILSAATEQLVTLMNIIALSNKPNLVKKLINDLDDDLLECLQELVPHLKQKSAEWEESEIINASWGIIKNNSKKLN